MEELIPTERGALLRSALSNSPLELGCLPPQTQRRIFREVAGYPFELALFLGDPHSASDPEGLLDEVHRQAGEYARLGYYVGRVPPDDLPVLLLVAALDKPLGGIFLEGLWGAIAEDLGWRRSESPPLENTLVGLHHRGLVESRDGRYGVLPVLARYLEEPESEHSLAPREQDRPHRQLARVFRDLGEGARDGAVQILRRPQVEPYRPLDLQRWRAVVHRPLQDLSGEHRLGVPPRP